MTVQPAQPRARAAPVAGPPARLGGHLLLLSVVLLFLVSALTLNLWNFNYESAGGTLFEKIHPATWAAIGALVLLVAGKPGLRALPNAIARRNPGLLLFLVGFGVLFQHIVLAQRMAFTPIIDTFLAPLVLFLCIERLPPQRRPTLALVLHAALLANALLGLYEFVSGWRLTPFAATASGIEFETDWRSSAFLGHPLTNAMTTGVYALILAQGGGRDLPPVLRPAALVAQLVAMVAFGGRASLVILLALMVPVGMRGGFRAARGMRINLLQLGLVLAAIPLVVLILDQAIASGFFDRLIERFTDDKGSAKSRVVLVQIINQFSWSELLIGPDPDKLASLQTLEGVEFGIESFWIGFMLAYGLVASLLFFIGLAAFCRELLRETRSGTLLVLVFFFAVASTSVSISTKTLTLAQMTVAVLVLLPKDPMRPRRAGVRAHG